MRARLKQPIEAHQVTDLPLVLQWLRELGFDVPNDVAHGTVGPGVMNFEDHTSHSPWEGQIRLGSNAAGPYVDLVWNTGPYAVANRAYAGDWLVFDTDRRRFSRFHHEDFIALYELL